MRTHLANAAYGMVDYLAYPVGLLAVAPVILRVLGIERYGVWAIATAAVSIGAVVASGFGDANIRSVAMQDAIGTRATVVPIVRTSLAIHLILGVAAACIGWTLAPWLASRVVATAGEMQTDCLWSLRIASLLIPLRAVETVCISTQRAFARYGHAIRISVLARLLSLLTACVLPFAFPEVTGILAASVAITGIGVWMQVRKLKALLGIAHLTPMLEPATARTIVAFGVFTWIQSASGLMFGQVDRIVTGAGFGAAAVSSYVICAQLAQPIYGVAAAGLHFLFPYLASREAVRDKGALRRGVVLAVVANAVFVCVALTALLVLGKSVLRLWGGEAIAGPGAALLPVIACSAALPALGLAGVYSMLALGQARTVAFLNVAGAVAMLVSAPVLMSRFGVAGMGYARLLYGPFILAVYLPLVLRLARKPEAEVRVDALSCEEA